MEIYPGTKLDGENPSGDPELATLSEELAADTSQLDITDPGWRTVLQPPDVEEPRGYQEVGQIEEVIGEF